MDNAKVDEVLRGIINRLDEDGYTPERWPADEEFPPFPASPQGPVVSVLACNHVLWMAREAITWGAERLEKKFRWLGFIQGVLWVTGEMTIEESKNMNKPAEEK